MDSKCSQIYDSLTNLLNLRNQFTEAYSRVNEGAGPHNPENQQAIRSSETKMKEIKEAIQELESLLHVSLEQAQEIMDREGIQNFMGPEQIKITFGIELKPEQIPKIPFSKEELEQARELGQMLVLRVDKASDGKPLTMEKLNGLLQGQTKDGKNVLYGYNETEKKMKDDCWYKNEDFFTKDSPQAGWALVSKEVIPHSHNESGVDEKRNYLVQTEKLIEYLTTKVFQGREIPPIYNQAIKEFNQIRQREKLDELITQDWQRAAQILENLQITQLLRQTPVEILYDLLIYFQNTGKRLLENIYTWSRRRDADGWLVYVGYFVADGAYVFSYRPDYSGDYLGVVFSPQSFESRYSPLLCGGVGGRLTGGV